MDPRTAISFAALDVAILEMTLVVLASALEWEIGRLARRSGWWQADDRRRLLPLITIAVTVVSLVALAVALLSSGKSPLTLR